MSLVGFGYKRMRKRGYRGGKRRNERNIKAARKRQRGRGAGEKRRTRTEQEVYSTSDQKKEEKRRGVQGEVLSYF